MAVKRFAYTGLAGACLLACLLGSSCQQMVVSYMQEMQKARQMIPDSAQTLEQFGEEEYEDNSADLDRRYTIIERKKEGSDSLFLARRYYTNGNKASDVWYNSDGKEEGLGIIYYPGGGEYAKLQFKKGMPYTVISCTKADNTPLDGGTLKNGTGSLKSYDLRKGYLESVYEFKNGYKEGSFINYYSNGAKKMEGTFVAGEMQGQVKAYFKSGALYQSFTFYEGKAQGVCNSYYSTGRLHRQETFVSGNLMQAEEFDEVGRKEATEELQNGGLVKTKFDYYPSGAMRSTARFINNFKNGNFNYYYENQALRAREVWHNDTLLSETSWHDNGKLKSEATCINGEREGIYREYYSNGNLRLEQEYHKGQKAGKYLSYYKNGNKYVVGAYNGEEPSGKFEIYAEDGTYKGANTY